MNIDLFDSIRALAAVATGAAIGYAFGLLQQAALRRHAVQQRSGQLKNGWSLIPGSGARVAYLVIALALIQLVCPLFFADHTKWIVSGGLVLGYGAVLLRQLRLKLKGFEA